MSATFSDTMKTNHAQFVYSAPGSGTHVGKEFAQKAATATGLLQWLCNRIPYALKKERCAICSSGHPEPRRLARIVGLLPINRRVALRDLREVTGERFETVSRDLHLLLYGLRLPGKRTRSCFRLKAPIAICEDCARAGAELRQTEKFQNQFRAALPGVTGLTISGVVSGDGRGELPDSSPHLH
jgi:hypothetical protein